MRVVCALMGLLLVPLCYLTVWELVKSTTAAFITGMMLVCETGTLVLSQYILLDPPLLFFIMAATYCTARFINCRDEPFDLEWWYWLTLSGMFIGCSFSVKWVGLFIIALVGLTTVKDLWDLMGDLRLSVAQIQKHFLARAVCLIIWPILLYFSVFCFHFLVLSHSGNGDGFFSSEFQSTLVGNDLYDQKVPEYVAYGSVITLKNRRGGGGLLHSHTHLYPEDLGEYQQQQITAYTHKDDNNKWLVKKTNSHAPLPGANSSIEDVEFIRNGDQIVLEHVMTKRNLHAHHQKAPMTPTHYQVTGYGENGVGDANDIWVVEILGSSGSGNHGDQVRTVTSVLKLRHLNLGCYLHSHSTQLPKWGWEQLEVTCNPQASDRNNLWNVEGNVHDLLPHVSFEFYKPSIFSKFLESHLVMAESNNNMKPKEGEITSKPWHWPINLQGQVFSGGDHRVYLLGNPIIFWGCGLLKILFVVVVMLKLFARQRGYLQRMRNEIQAELDVFTSNGLWLLVGWALHYLPFYLMGRVLYFHHYFPALMFSIMLAGVTIEYSIRLLTALLHPALKPLFYHTSVAVVLFITVVSFLFFMPLAYGMSGPKSDNPESSMYGLKWLPDWDILAIV
ncbi:Protein O-mannosyl-transferase 2 [Geodia barretti]|nr:Protein O-mannosyl-transferase 2 [Geodia barretti]